MKHDQFITDYWVNRPYHAPNVESYVFRLYHVLFRNYNITPDSHPLLLDYGCGQGALLSFFHRQNFSVYGVDVSQSGLELLRQTTASLAERVQQIGLSASAEDRFFAGKFSLITSIQTLYYLSASELKTRLNSLNAQLEPGGYVFFTMMGRQHYLAENAVLVSDGLYDLNLEEHPGYTVQLMDSREMMTETFEMFEPLELGYYDIALLEKQGSRQHFTFFGKKRS